MTTSPIRITATVHHIEHNESFYRVRYRAESGGWKTILILRDKFYNSDDVAKSLVRKGAMLPDDIKAASALIEEAVSARKKKHIEITSRAGWHGDSFVYFDKTFGPATKLHHEGANRINPALGLRHGTLQAALDGLREPCQYSDYLLFTMSVAASGPLLDMIGEEEGGMYHLHGTTPADADNPETRTMSTVGKSLSARTGSSVIGRCRKNDLITFAITRKAVEDLCFAHNNLLVVFDEEGRALSGDKSKTVSRELLPYEIPGGKGTVRSNKATQDQNLVNLTWALPAISSGETPLDPPNSKIKRPEGAQVRMVPLPVPPGKDGGIFNRVTGTPEEISEKCKALAKQVNDTISENYGVIMPAYLEKLVPQKAVLALEVQKLIDTFVTKVVGNAIFWECRFAEKFGVVLAAAVMLSRFELGPWTEERAWEAVEAMYRKSRGASVSIEQATNAVLKRLRKFAKDKAKFPRVPKGKEVTAAQKAKVWGVVREVDGLKNVLLIPRKKFANLVKPSAVAEQVLKTLAKRKALIPDSDKKKKKKSNTRQVMIKGLDKERHRYVCLPGLVAKKAKAAPKKVRWPKRARR